MQSADVAPPAFSMKFAWRGEMSAPPIRWPFSPHASISRPAPSSRARVLEDAAERPLVRRLRRLALREQLRDLRLDRLGRARLEPEAHPRHDLARPRAPNGGRTARARRSASRARPVGIDDDRVDQHVAPLAPVRAGVHPHAAARGAGDRGGELEAAEAGGARAMEADRVRRAAARDERRPPRPRAAASSPASLSTSASTPSSCDEQVRAEPDHLDRRRRRRAPTAATLAQLLEGLRPREPARRPAGPDRREPRERDVLLDLTPPSSRRPRDRRRPRRAPAARRRRGRGASSRAAPCSTRRRPRRRARRGRDSASTISFPVTPGTGCSRAG